MKNKLLCLIAIALLSAIMVGTATAQPAEIYNGTVKLNDGNFTFVPSNNPSNSYQIGSLTDLGALDTASKDKTSGFTYNASDAYYQYYGSFYITDISGIGNTYDQDTMTGTSWFIYVNDTLVPLGLSQNAVSDGSQVAFLYCPYYLTEDYQTVIDKENATYAVDIGVKEDPIADIENLKGYINNLDAPQPTKCILNASLDSVTYSLDHGRDQIAIAKLKVFKNIVERQKNRGNLTPEAAQYLKDKADHIIALIR